MADGTRGRRWRAVATVDGSISHSALIEVDPAGRPARLELTTPNGMLTLHPSADEAEIHGNVVRPGGGVEPLALGWSTECELDIIGRPLALGIGLNRRRASVPIGAMIEIDVVAVGPELSIQTTKRRIQRLSETDWRILALGGGPARRISLDADGLPVGGVRWPLEAD